MAFFVYFVVLLISGASVLFGLDWLSSPMSPMAPIKPVIQAAKAPPPPARTVATPVAPTPPIREPQRDVATAVAPQPAPDAVVPAADPPAAVAPAATVNAPLAAAEAEQANAAEPANPLPQIAVEDRPKAKCDVDACASAYRSFTAEDCTYQPSVGPRRLCTKGAPPNEAAGARDASASRADAGTTAAQCNVSACAAVYGSFNAADCTYQPFDGPRRLCEK